MCNLHGPLKVDIIPYAFVYIHHIEMGQGDFVIRQSLHLFHIHFLPKGTAVAKLMKHRVQILDLTPHTNPLFFRKLPH